jgi:hypothetical protein
MAQKFETLAREFGNVIAAAAPRPLRDLLCRRAHNAADITLCQEGKAALGRGRRIARCRPAQPAAPIAGALPLWRQRTTQRSAKPLSNCDILLTAVHAGQEPDKTTNSRAVPIYQTTSYGERL